MIMNVVTMETHIDDAAMGDGRDSRIGRIGEGGCDGGRLFGVLDQEAHENNSETVVKICVKIVQIFSYQDSSTSLRMTPSFWMSV